MTQSSSGRYIGYEYKQVPAAGQDISLLLDCYESFGWQQDENHPFLYMVLFRTSRPAFTSGGNFYCSHFISS